MRKGIAFMVVGSFLFLVISNFAKAQDDVTGPFKFSLGADASFTDNRDSTVSGEEESNTDIYIKPKVDALFDWGDSILDFFWMPNYRYRTDPGVYQDTSKLFQDFGLHGRHAFTDRLGVHLKEFFKYTDDPTLSSGGINVSEDGAYFINDLSGGLSINVAPESRIDLDAGWMSKQYDEGYFEYLDEDAVDGSLSFRQQISPSVTVVAQGSVRQFSYGDTANGGDIPDSDRDFDSLSGGLGIENQFYKDSKISIYAGYSTFNFKQDGMDDQNSPYATLLLDHRVNASTVVSGAAMYGIRETAISQYSVQEYSDVRGDIYVDVSKSITVGGGGIYRHSKYDEDGMTPVVRQYNKDHGLVIDGTQKTLVMFGSVAYKLTEDALVKFVYNYTTDDSDVSVDFDKNTAILSFVQNF